MKVVLCSLGFGPLLVLKTCKFMSIQYSLSSTAWGCHYDGKVYTNGRICHRERIYWWYFTYKGKTTQVGHIFPSFIAWHHVGVTHWIPIWGVHVTRKINSEPLPQIVLGVFLFFLFWFKPISLAVCLHSSARIEDNNGTERLFFRFRLFCRSYVTLAMMLELLCLINLSILLLCINLTTVI